MNKPNSKKRLELAQRRDAPLATRTDLSAAAVKDISGTMNAILADVFALYVEPLDMLAELADDNKTLAARLREAHNVCEEHRDVATTSLIEVWIDETERRTWFLSEIKRNRN